MIELITGQKCKVLDIVRENILRISAKLIIKGGEIDISCFAVDKQGKLLDDRYFIFYNQLSSPEGAIRKEPSAENFIIKLSDLPDNIDKLVLTGSIDGEMFMSDLNESSVIFGDNEARFTLNGGQFQKERAIILAEIYYHGGQWRLCIVGKGFNGGLSALLAHFGGEEIKEAAAAPVSLKKSERVHNVVLEKAPRLIDLTKKAIVSLEKKNLMDVKAQVVLVLDVSGSMTRQYKQGRVQRILDKVLPLALLFDEDGRLESWGFASRYKKLMDATLDTIEDYIIKADGGWNNWNIGLSNNEPAVMEELYSTYKNSKIPVYIIFISDGGVSQNKKIKELITTASSTPMFWQFVGVGGSGYGALEKLDDLKGRVVDNANFFALDDIDSINDEALYDRLMSEFPIWLREVKEKHII